VIRFTTKYFRSLAALLGVAALAIAVFPGRSTSQQLNSNNAIGPFAPGGAYSYQQFLGPFFNSPFFNFSPNSLVVTWSAGQIYVGNGAVPVVQGSVTLTASKTTCARANIIAGSDSCNYIYASSAGVVATNTAIATAAASGNSLLAMAVTSSTGVTSLQAPYQDTSGFSITSSGAFFMTVNNTPAATSAAIQTVAQTFTYTGLASGDNVVLVNYPAPTSLCPATEARATATNTLSIYFTVLTAAACTPAAGNYTIAVYR
jgi:hypothetical protein